MPQTPRNGDSYCDHPEPWERQDWTDDRGNPERITGGLGADWIVGGGANNVLTESKTYANHSTAQTTVTLLASSGKHAYGLTGVPNSVDVHNGKGGDTVNCSSPSNRDTVYADRGDTASSVTGSTTMRRLSRARTHRCPRPLSVFRPR